MSVPVYQWQPTSLDIAERLGIDVSDVIRFDQNTSPWRPEWTAPIAASAADRLNEYPFADYRTLRTAAGAYQGVAADWVVAGAGADELIGLCAAAFIPVGGLAVSAPPTYGLYAIATAHREARLWDIPRTAPDYALDLPAMADAARKADAVWLCVPNNPTGHRDPTADIVELLEAAGGIVIVDGAYAEYAGDRWGRWVERYSNLVVLHTLSKAFGLAGIRVGYALAQPELIEQIDRRRPPGSIGSVSAAIAERALAEPDTARNGAAAIARERRRMATALSDLGLEVLPSVTNFVLVRWGPGARSIAEALMWTHGMVVRTFDAAGPLADHLRFTVRAPDENDRILGLLKGLLP